MVALEIHLQNLRVHLESEKTEITMSLDQLAHLAIADQVHLRTLHLQEVAAVEVAAVVLHHLVLDLADLVNFYEKENIIIRFGDTIIVEPLCTIC